MAMIGATTATEHVDVHVKSRRVVDLPIGFLDGPVQRVAGAAKPQLGRAARFYGAGEYATTDSELYSGN